MPVSFVLASLRGSTYKNEVRLASSLAATDLRKGRVSARQGWAGENGGLFEHPTSRERKRYKEIL